MDNKPQLKKITLGSGKIYCKEFTGKILSMGELIDEMMNEEFELCKIQGGASIEYKSTTYSAKSDDGTASKEKITDEEATMKFGICTWTGETLQKICSTARISEDAERGIRIVKIGGIDNDDGKYYVLLFVHKDKKDGDCYLALVGKNASGFNLAFAKDKESIIEPEFAAHAMDSEGTLFIYADEETPGSYKPATTPKAEG